MNDTDATTEPHVSCDSCDWTLTVSDVVERLREKEPRRVSARRVRQKFGSLGEGHAYFNRGHAIDIHGDESAIQEILDDEASE